MRTLSDGSAGLKLEVRTLDIQNAEQEYNRSTIRSVFNGLKLIVNYTYHPHFVHTCYSSACFSQSGRIILPHAVNRLVFVVQTNLYFLWWEFKLHVFIIQVKYSLQWPSRVSGRGPVSIPGLCMWDMWSTKWHWDRLFSEYFGLSTSVQLLHTHLCNNTLFRKTIWQRIENFKNVTFFGISGSITQNCTVTVSCV